MLPTPISVPCDIYVDICLLANWWLCVCGVAYWRVGPRSVGRHSGPVHGRDAWQNRSCCGHSSTNPQLQVWRAARLWRVSCQQSDSSVLQLLAEDLSLLVPVLWQDDHLKICKMGIRTVLWKCQWGTVRELKNIGWDTTTTTVLQPFVRDYLGELVPEETLTHPPSWSSSNLYQLLPPTAICSILSVQIVCLAVFLHNLSTGHLWSTSWSGALHLMFHTLLRPVGVWHKAAFHIPSSSEGQLHVLLLRYILLHHLMLGNWLAKSGNFLLPGQRSPMYCEVMTSIMLQYRCT